MDNIIQVCRNRNKTIDTALSDAAKHKTLLEYVNEEFAKVGKGKYTDGFSPEDISKVIYEYVRKQSGETTAQKVTELLKSNTLITADHYGGIYSTQSFQGDLLYYAGLKEAGFNTSVVPILAYSQVPMNNSTFPRGLILYENDGEPLKLPVTASKYRTYSVGQVPPVSKKEIEALKKKIKNEAPSNIVERLAALVEEIYGQDKVLEAKDYRTQLYYVAGDLYKKVLGADEMCFIECEEVFRELMKKDLENRESLVYRLLFDKSFWQVFDAEFEGISLFAGIDDSGRAFPLTIHEGNYLTGSSRDGAKVQYEINKEKIVELLDNKKIVVSMVALALMSSFQRGVSLFGGEFQAIYLEEWKEKTTKALRATGEEGLAKRVENTYCKGYISGPSFALTTGNNGLVNAGPLEMIINDKTYGDISHLLEETSLYDSQIMGMYEFYNDLTLSNEKIEGWYGTITNYFKTNFERNSIKG